MDTEISDSALLQAWQRHRDAEAFHAIVGRHGRLVYNTCRHILRNDTDAADVSQECFLSLASTPPSIRYSLSGWLHRLATHRSLDHLKAAKRRREREVRYAREAVVSGNDEQADLMAMVDEAIDALPDDLRLPLIEHFLRQKSHQEVADGLGIPRRTVTYRINSGVDRVREQLKRKGVAVPILGLSALLGQESVQAADALASIYATLGKHALVGVSTVKVPANGVVAAIALKKAWFAVAFAVILALAWWLVPSLSPRPQEPGRSPVSLTMGEQEDSLPKNSEPGSGVPLAEVIADGRRAEALGVQDAVLVGKISGRVFDEDSLDPVAGTKVVVVPSGEVSNTVNATTNANGAYETPDLPAGNYVVYRDKTPGYAPTQRKGVGKKSSAPGRISGTHLSLSGDATVDFPVRKGLIVAGTVLDKRERGIEGAEVMASVLGSEYAQSTSTDAEGRFSLAGFSPTANLHIRVKKQGYGEAALSNLRLVMPGTEDLKIHLTNAASISGTVVDHHGQALEGVRVAAAHMGSYGGWSFDYPEGTSGAAGAFTIADLSPGRYNLQAIPRGYESYLSSSPVWATLSEGEHRRDVRLAIENGDGIEIAGQVTDQANSPLEGVQITLIGSSGRTGISDAQGNFRIGGLAEGEYGILPVKMGYRERGKTQVVLDHSFRASRDDLHLVLEKFALRLEGIVHDAKNGEPLSGFEVAALAGLGDDTAIASHAWSSGAHFANSDGSFAVDVAVPWRFEVGSEGPVCAVYVRKTGYAPKMMLLPAAGDSETVYAEVDLEPGRTIAGVVADHYGTPVSGAIIAEGKLVTDTVSRRTDLALSDAEGHFEVVGLREGVDALTAIHPAHPLASAVIGDGAQSVRIVFGASGEIEGTILMDGVPMPFRDASLESRSMASSFGTHGAADQWGRFYFGALIPGEYDLTINDWLGARVAATYVKRVMVNPDRTTTVDFNLTSGTSLGGTIRVDGLAPAWARIELDVVSDELNANCEPHVNADGSWRIDNVTPGFGTLTVEAGVTDGETLRRTTEVDLAPGEVRVIDMDLADESDAEPSKE